MKKLFAVLFISLFGTGAAMAQDLRGGGATGSKGLTKNESAVQNDMSNRKSDNASSAGAGALGSPATSAGSGASGSDAAGSAGSSAATISGTSGSSNSGGNMGSTDGGGAGVTTGISGAGIPGNQGTMDGTKGNNSPYIGAGSTTPGSSGSSGADKPATTGTGIPSAATGGSEKHLFRGQSPEPSKSREKKSNANNN